MQLLLFLSLVVASVAAPQKFFIVPPESTASEPQEGGGQRNQTLIPISLFSGISNVGVPLIGQPVVPTKKTASPLQRLVKPKPAVLPLESSSLSRRKGDNEEKIQLSFDEILNSMFIKKPVQPIKPKPVVPILLKQKETSPSLRSKTGVSLDILSQNIEGQELGMFIKLPSKETEKISKKPTQLEKHKNLSQLRKSTFKTNENETKDNNLQNIHDEGINNSIQEALIPGTILPDVFSTVVSSFSKDPSSQSIKEVNTDIEQVSESTAAEEGLVIRTSEDPIQTSVFETENLQTSQNDTTEFDPKISENISVDKIITVLPTLNNDFSQTFKTDLTTEIVIETELTTLPPPQETASDSPMQLETDTKVAEINTELPFVGDLIPEAPIKDNVDEAATTTSQSLENLPLEELTTHLSVSEISRGLFDPVTEEAILQQHLLNEDSTTILPFEDDFILDTTTNLAEESIRPAEETTIKLLETHEENASLRLLSELSLEQEFSNESATTDLPVQSELITNMVIPEAPVLLEEIDTSEPSVSELLRNQEIQTESSSDSTVQDKMTTGLIDSEILTSLGEKEIKEPPTTEALLDQEILTEIGITEFSAQDSSVSDLTDAEFIDLLEEKDILDSHITKFLLDQAIQEERITTELSLQEEVIGLTNKRDPSLDEKNSTESSIIDIPLNEEIVIEKVNTELPIQNKVHIDSTTLLESHETLEPLHQTENIITDPSVPLNVEMADEKVNTELPIQNKVPIDIITLLEGHETLKSVHHTERIITDSLVEDKLAKHLVTSEFSALEVDSSSMDNPELLFVEEVATENFLKETTLSHADLVELITTERPTEITLISENVKTDLPTTEEIEDIVVTTEFLIEDKTDKEVQSIIDEEQVEVTTVNLLLENENHPQLTKAESPLSDKAIKAENKILTEKSLGKTLLSDLISNEEDTKATTILPTVESSVVDFESGVMIIEESNKGDIETEEIFTVEKAEIKTEESITELVTEALSIESTTEGQSTFTDQVTVPQTDETLSSKISSEEALTYPSIEVESLSELPLTESLIELATEAGKNVEETTDTIASEVTTTNSVVIESDEPFVTEKVEIKSEDEILTEKPIGKSLFSDSIFNEGNNEATTILPIIKSSIESVDSGVTIAEEFSFGGIEGEEVLTAEKEEIITDKSIIELVTESVSIEIPTEKQTISTDKVTVLPKVETQTGKVSNEEDPALPSTEVSVESVTELDSNGEETVDTIAVAATTTDNSVIVEGDKPFATEKVESITELVTEIVSFETNTEKQTIFTDRVAMPEVEETTIVKTSGKKASTSSSTEVLVESATEADSNAEETEGTFVDDVTTFNIASTDSAPATANLELSLENRDEKEIIISENATESSFDDKIVSHESSSNKPLINELDSSVTEITTDLPSEKVSDSTIIENKPSESTDPLVDLIKSESPTLQDEVISIVTESSLEADKAQIMQEKSSNKVTEMKPTTHHDDVSTTNTHLTANEAHLEADSKIPELSDQSLNKITEINQSVQQDVSTADTSLAATEASLEAENNVQELSDQSSNKITEREESVQQDDGSIDAVSLADTSLTATEAPLEAEGKVQELISQSSNKVTEANLSVQQGDGSIDAVSTADTSSTATESPLEAEGKVQELTSQSSNKVTEANLSVQQGGGSIADTEIVPIQAEHSASKLPEEPVLSDSSVLGKAILSATSNILISENQIPLAKNTKDEVPFETVASSSSIPSNTSQTVVNGTTDIVNATVSKANDVNILSKSSIVDNNTTIESKTSGSELPIDASNPNINRLLTDAEITSLLFPKTKSLNAQTPPNQNLGRTLTANPQLNRFLLRTNLAARHFGFKTPSSVLLTKQIPFNFKGAFVDPKTLVAPQFRNFIYENEAPEVTAAKIAFFKVQDGLTSVHNQP